MNLWLRLLRLLLTSWRGPRISSVDGVSDLGFRVWPHDLDTSMHLNNGRYWTLMDLGRADFLLRTGLWRSVLAKKWTPVVNAGEVRFRRELALFQRFRLMTSIRGWTETHLIIEHRFVAADDGIAAIALVRAALYDRAARRFVPIRELIQDIEGVDAAVESPPFTPEIVTFLAAEDALKAVTARPDAEG